jgi:hypothetical protein
VPPPLLSKFPAKINREIIFGNREIFGKNREICNALRSRQPDGKQATSKQSVVVALDEVESSSGAVRSRAEVPFNVPDTLVPNRSVLDQAVGSSQAHQPSQPPLQITKRQDIAVSQQPHATAATPLSPTDG